MKPMSRLNSKAQREAPVYTVHVRFVAHPERRRPVEWAEPPLGLGRYHGGYEVIGRSADLDGLVRWVLGFVAHVEVVGPDALRERVAEEARRIAALHNTTASADE